VAGPCFAGAAAACLWCCCWPLRLWCWPTLALPVSINRNGTVRAGLTVGELFRAAWVDQGGLLLPSSLTYILAQRHQLIVTCCVVRRGVGLPPTSRVASAPLATPWRPCGGFRVFSAGKPPRRFPRPSCFHDPTGIGGQGGFVVSRPHRNGVFGVSAAVHRGKTHCGSAGQALLHPIPGARAWGGGGLPGLSYTKAQELCPRWRSRRHSAPYGCFATSAGHHVSVWWRAARRLDGGPMTPGRGGCWLKKYCFSRLGAPRSLNDEVQDGVHLDVVRVPGGPLVMVTDELTSRGPPRR
jgi:hypothetical protein